MAHATARQREKLRSAILQHLAAHPLVADTTAGIVGNWLPAHGFEYALEHIDSVLDALVEARVLRRHRLPDGNFLYAASVDR